MLDEYERVAALADFLEDFPKCCDIASVETAGGFVKCNQKSVQVPSAETCKLESLQFTARKCLPRASWRKVTDSQIVDSFNAVEERIESRL